MESRGRSDGKAGKKSRVLIGFIGSCDKITEDAGMRKYSGIPEILEEYMAESGSAERWVTVWELRERFGFARQQCTGVARFLRRLHEGAFRQYPFIVLKIERAPASTPRDMRVCRYLIKRREYPSAQQKRTERLETTHETQ